LVEEEDDTKATAETDEILERTGWVRTEESVRDVYGDGYERKAVPPPPPPPPPPAPDNRRPLIDGGTLEPRDPSASFAEAAPPRDIVDHAVDQIMADEGWRPAMAPIVEQLLAELARAGSPDEVAKILARSAELDDESGLIEALARAGFAVGMAAASGQDATV
jgi:hypothetical protein